jgi:hypothetical protein
LIIHVHSDGGADASSNITIDPVAVEEAALPMTDLLTEGVQRRWDAILTGECECGAEVLPIRRAIRRKHRMRATGFIQHHEGCEAMAAAVRSWHFQHHRMSQ